MKIGTDGVLLGAWAEAEDPKYILDIGSGTGLIALMLAQRFPNAQITAIEMEKNAAEESAMNFSESLFRDRCRAFHTSLQDFRSEIKFDLIVSNPPFFKLTHPTDTSRNKARQQSELEFVDLLMHSRRLLSESGKCAYIIPFEAENELMVLAEKSALFPMKITRVKGNPHSEFKRSLMLFSQIKNSPMINELTVELSRGIYTEDYINLTKDFYLKM